MLASTWAIPCLSHPRALLLGARRTYRLGPPGREHGMRDPGPVTHLAVYCIRLLDVHCIQLSTVYCAWFSPAPNVKLRQLRNTVLSAVYCNRLPIVLDAIDVPSPAV
jgi:hypothetical protein